MRAGALKHRLSVRRLAPGAANALNQKNPAWVERLSVACSFQPVSDGERLRAAGLGAVFTARFVVRDSSEARQIEREDRVVFTFKGRTSWYDIVGIKPTDGEDGLEITANTRSDAVPA